MEYNVDYFIAKFESIPEEKWCVDRVTNKEGQHCAFGHCSADKGANCIEGEKLYRLTTPEFLVADVNDGRDKKYQQPTPKQRILAALYDIKFKEVNRLISNIKEKELSTNKENQNELSTY